MTTHELQAQIIQTLDIIKKIAAAGARLDNPLSILDAIAELASEAQAQVRGL